MKTTLLLFITAITLSSIYAQEDSSFGFEKGDFTISGTMNYSYQNSESFRNNIEGESYKFETKGHNFSIIPEIGYFISSHLMAGLKFGYISSKTENYDNDLYDFSSKGKGYSTGIFGRYYFSPQKRVSLFIELNAGYQMIKTDSDRIFQVNNLTTSTDKNESYNMTAAPGINLFVNKNLSLTSRIGSIGYSHIKDSFNDSDGDIGTNKRDRFNANISLSSLYFGVLYRI
ncbi:hypothetical protein D1818_09280 [Aquimarina sp. BL5]|uniref:outer membrane beta-barrel protein n=1 Tax=Aquimarina sp. BL5 TaxID=1714860 RepID=UPI000E483EB1|nr:outer membrane beta-barrel protein [Aquimarina sp. BL5]AXT51007.1 hypothetical protein D1818_09280 [Aquimarina sp. BL5]RKN06575.1 hypothetical protein D7036_08915 [Aquimarina sp. BL5]